MGLFDWLFQKTDKQKQNLHPSQSKQNNHSTTRPADPGKAKIKNLNFDDEWVYEINNLMRINAQAKRPVHLFNKAYPDNYKPAILSLKLAYEYGAGNASLEDINYKHKNGYHTYLNTIYQLNAILKSNDLPITPRIKTCFKGCVDIEAQLNIEEKNRQDQKFKSNISTISGLNDSYLVSRYLEHFIDVKLEKKLLSLFETYLALHEEIFKDVSDELKAQISAEHKPLELEGTAVFNDLETVISYLDLRRKQERDITRDTNYSNNKALVFKEAIETLENTNEISLLFFYEKVNQYSNDKSDKETLKLLISKLDLDYDLFHKFLDVFIHKDYNGKLITGTQILKIIKSYFAHEPLDPKSYLKIKKCMSKCDTLSKAAGINEFLYQKSDHLYQLHSSEIHQLLHSGILHDNQSFYGYGNSAKKIKYIGNLMTLLSQVTTAILITENQGKGFMIRINDETFDVQTNELSVINRKLHSQAIPYQLVKHEHENSSKKRMRNSSYYTTLLLNEEQFHSLKSYIKTSSNKGQSFADVEFATNTTMETIAVNNHMKKVSKEKDSELSSNRFLHDIKWKEVKNVVIDELPNYRKWYQVMHEIVSCPTSVVPSETWFKKTAKAVSVLDTDELHHGYQKLMEDVMSRDLWFNKENIKALRGIIWTTTNLENLTACEVLNKILVKSYEKIKHVGPRSIGGGSSCMQALIKRDTAESYQVLKNIHTNTKYERLQNQIAYALREFESKSKATVSSLKEAAVDDFEFVNGAKRKEISPNEIVKWKIKNRKATSTWVDSNDKKLKKAPTIAPALRKQNMALTKTMNESISNFDFRMDEYRFADISWDGVQWKINYLENEFIKLIIDSYLWIKTDEHNNDTVFITKDQKALNIDNQELVISDTDKIKPYHQTYITNEINDAWKVYFVQHKITPHIEFFYRLLTPKDKLIDEIEKVVSISKSVYISGWISVGQEGKKSSYAKELAFLNKVFVLTMSEDGKVTFDYYKMPKKKKRRYSYQIAEFTEKIPLEKIPEKVHIECLIESLNAMQERLNGLGDDKVKELAYYNHRAEIFLKTNEINYFPAATYNEDKIVHIKGQLHEYLLDTISGIVKIKGKPEHRSMNAYRQRKGGNPFTALGFPTVGNDQLIGMFWMIKQLSADLKITDLYLKNWIARKN